MLVPPAAWRYVSMNTTIKPFDDINVRKAVIAGFDRNAMRLARGGALVGDIADALPPAGHRRLRRGGRHEGPGRRLHRRRPASRTRRSRPSTSRRRATPPASTTGSEELLMVGTIARASRRRPPRSRRRTSSGSASRSACASSPRTRCTRSTATCPTAKVAICPNVALGQGLRRRPDDPRPDVQRREHHPAATTRTGRSSTTRRSTPRWTRPSGSATRRSGRRRGPTSTRRSPTLAPGVPWIWDKQPLIASADVNGVV